jgi:hypothetical protein
MAVFERFIGGRVDEKRITANWNDALRFATSVRTGAASASLLLKRLGACPRQTKAALSPNGVTGRNRDNRNGKQQRSAARRERHGTPPIANAAKASASGIISTCSQASAPLSSPVAVSTRAARNRCNCMLCLRPRAAAVLQMMIGSERITVNSNDPQEQQRSTARSRLVPVRPAKANHDAAMMQALPAAKKEQESALSDLFARQCCDSPWDTSQISLACVTFCFSNATAYLQVPSSRQIS